LIVTPRRGVLQMIAGRLLHENTGTKPHTLRLPCSMECERVQVAPRLPSTPANCLQGTVVMNDIVSDKIVNDLLLMFTFGTFLLGVLTRVLLRIKEDDFGTGDATCTNVREAAAPSEGGALPVDQVCRGDHQRSPRQCRENLAV
jgi:hypothetical protein